MPAPASAQTHSGVRTVQIPPLGLEGFLGVPQDALGIVVFAHGSGSSRLSRRNNAVATELRSSGLGTLLFDLLSPEEEADRQNVFDIELLSQRLQLAANWIVSRNRIRELPIGYFGGSTGAAAALVAAARSPTGINAIVSRGGRPDLAGAALEHVQAPTLLIVGGADREVLALNEAALARLRCKKHLTVVPGATHLFEEPGALAQVTELARDWFLSCLDASPTE